MLFSKKKRAYSPENYTSMYPDIVLNVEATYTLSTMNVVLVLAKIMEEIEMRGRKMYGSEKKRHSLHIIKLMVHTSSHLDDAEKQYLLQYIDNSGDQIINTMISASNGELRLRKKWDITAVMSILSVFCVSSQSQHNIQNNNPLYTNTNTNTNTSVTQPPSYFRNTTSESNDTDHVEATKSKNT